MTINCQTSQVLLLIPKRGDYRCNTDGNKCTQSTCPKTSSI